jgi:predicted cupin superfamily sugar epimerase
MHPRATELIERLALAPHPEGGFFKERIRAREEVTHPQHGAKRSALTCIEFLLVEGTFSALHVVKQIEVWHHLEGEPVALHLLDEAAQEHQRIVLGKDLAAGQVMQAAVPANVWQAAVPLGSYALCGCTVAPGFDFADFELAGRDALLAEYPRHQDWIRRLT